MPRCLGVLVLAASTIVSTVAPQCFAREDVPANPATAPAPTKPVKATSTMEYISVDSKALDATINVGVYLPAAYTTDADRKFPTIYFLHGMFGTERKWQQRETDLQLDDLIEKKLVPPLIVICPAGYNSMYVNWFNGKGRWMDFITDDLVKAMEAKYRIDGRREMRGISGDSMGGFGALNIGFQNPSIYGSVSAHSAALFPADPNQVNPKLKRWAKEWGEVFGDPIDLPFWKKNNPIDMAATADESKLKSLAIYFDVGERDEFGFDKTSAQLHDALEARKIPHTYVLRSGDHGKNYFRANVEHSLRFHGDLFSQADATRPKDG